MKFLRSSTGSPSYFGSGAIEKVSFTFISIAGFLGIKCDWYYVTIVTDLWLLWIANILSSGVHIIIRERTPQLQAYDQRHRVTWYRKRLNLYQSTEQKWWVKIDRKCFLLFVKWFEEVKFYSGNIYYVKMGPQQQSNRNVTDQIFAAVLMNLIILFPCKVVKL